METTINISAKELADLQAEISELRRINDQLRQELSNSIRAFGSDETIPLDHILDCSCKYMMVSRAEAMSKSREANKYIARFLFASYARMNTRSSLNEIAAKINRDHSTVSHSVRLLNNDLTMSQKYKDFVKHINNEPYAPLHQG